MNARASQQYVMDANSACFVAAEPLRPPRGTDVPGGTDMKYERSSNSEGTHDRVSSVTRSFEAYGINTILETRCIQSPGSTFKLARRPQRGLLNGYYRCRCSTDQMCPRSRQADPCAKHNFHDGGRSV